MGVLKGNLDYVVNIHEVCTKETLITRLKSTDTCDKGKVYMGHHNKNVENTDKSSYMRQRIVICFIATEIRTALHKRLDIIKKC